MKNNNWKYQIYISICIVWFLLILFLNSDLPLNENLQSSIEKFIVIFSHLSGFVYLMSFSINMFTGAFALSLLLKFIIIYSIQFILFIIFIIFDIKPLFISFANHDYINIIEMFGGIVLLLYIIMIFYKIYNHFVK